MLRPLGRVLPATVQRFADKHPDSIVQQELDLTDWLAEVDGDTIDSADVTSDGVNISDIAIDGALVTWLAAAGTNETDVDITIVTTAASNRIDVQTWKCWVYGTVSVAGFFAIGVSAVGGMSYLA